MLRRTTEAPSSDALRSTAGGIAAAAPAGTSRGDRDTHLVGSSHGEVGTEAQKPVQFDFLDFSTAQKRREACEEEVRLNRRLANDVYVGVVPVTVDARGRPSLDEALRQSH